MERLLEIEDPRRRLLIQALAAGFFSVGFPGANALAAGIFGRRPTKLPAGKSIYRISGLCTVNGQEVTPETLINPGDTVQTAKDSELIFVVSGGHAMILRANSHLDIEAGKGASGSLLIDGLRLLSGRLLSVSRHAVMHINTATATIGIRGTGFYVEAYPEWTYFCTCYGTTDVAANADRESRTTVDSKHHDRPLYIVQDGGQGKNIRNAPMIDHTDQELELIEALVDRVTPFIFENAAYSTPRRDNGYY